MVASPLRRASLLLTALLLTTGAAGPGSAQTTLRYKFTKGEKLHYILEQKVTMSVKDTTAELGHTFDVTWTILDVDADGKAKMTHTFDRVRFKMSGGAIGKVEYDSQDGKLIEGPAGKALNPLFKAFTGAEISLTMDPQGKVSNMIVPEKLLQVLRKAQGGGAGLGEVFSEEGLKKAMDQSRPLLPKDAVSKGATWEQKFEEKTKVGVTRVEITNTLESPIKRDGKELERLSMKPKMTVESDPDAPVRFTIKSQDSSGIAYFDNAAGRFVETNMTRKIEMTAAFGGREVTQKMEQTETLKLVPKQ
jgi:hypothetical protein